MSQREPIHRMARHTTPGSFRPPTQMTSAPGPHFHTGQPKVDPTREIGDFGWSDRPNSEIEPYGRIGGSHHIFYGVAPPS